MSRNTGAKRVERAVAAYRRMLICHRLCDFRLQGPANAPGRRAMLSMLAEVLGIAESTVRDLHRRFCSRKGTLEIWHQIKQ